MKKFLLFSLLTIALGGFAQSASAQSMKVSGTVTYADDDSAVIGATVLVEGTSVVTVTDVNGMYSITVPANSSKRLLVAYTGVVPQEKPVTQNNEVINFEMATDAKSIESVVVTGYGNVATSSFAGSAAVVRTESMKDVPTASLNTRLAGNVAGLTVTSTSGQPGAVESVRIRGMGSINAGNEPLYVIDGVPMQSGNAAAFDYSDAGTSILSTINPNDIESFTVIKDAAAASLYGSRAANGVIVITTKKGNAGKTQFNVKYDTGFSDMAVNWRPVLNGADRREILELGLYNYGVNSLGYDATDATAYMERNIGAFASEPWSGYTDWRDILFRTGYNQNMEASVSGGNQKTRFFASLSYLDQEGIVYQQSYDRVTGRVSVDHKSGIFSLTASSNFSSSNQSVSSEGRSYASPFMAAAFTVSPSDYAYNEDGSINNTTGFSLVGGGLYNPVWIREYDYDTNKVTRSLSNVSAQLDLFDGFNVKQTLTYDFLQSNNSVWWDPRTGSGFANGGVMQRYMLNNSRLTSQTMASYRKLIATKHSISALVSFEAENNTEDYTFVNGSDYATYLKPQISNAATTRGSSGLNENSMLSLVGKADYTFDNKLYLGGSFRRDGSSRLSPETRWGNFWSVAGYWRLSQEDFWTNAGLKDILTDTKIRASYGENGTQPSNWFDWMGLYSLSAKYNGYAASYQSTIANDALTWERNLATNIGLDITLINRINIAFDWYNRDTKDLILSQPISSTSGFSSMLQNVGSMRNRGWEVSVNATAVETADWQVNLGLNVAQNRNTLTALNDGTTEAQFVSTSLMQRVGEAYYSFYRYEYAGVDPETGKESFYKNTTNADGSINREITTNINECQRTIVGNTEPLFTGGFNSQVSYKWFDLSFTLTYSVGGNALDMASWIQTGGGSFNYNGNVPSYFEIDKTWKNPGDIAELPVFQYGSTSQASDRWMVSTDHLRLKNLTLGFSAPKAWTDAIHLKKARLYVSGSNLLTLKSKDCYFDPEVPITGLVYFESPQLRTVTMGIEIGF